MGSLEEKMGKISEDVSAFIDNYAGILSTNNTKMLKITESFKKKTADGVMNPEPAPL
jgi:hypothetical protein